MIQVSCKSESQIIENNTVVAVLFGGRRGWEGRQSSLSKAFSQAVTPSPPSFPFSPLPTCVTSVGSRAFTLSYTPSPFYFILRQDFAKHLSSSAWAQTRDPPASASLSVGMQVCTTEFSFPFLRMLVSPHGSRGSQVLTLPSCRPLALYSRLTVFHSHPCLENTERLFPGPCADEIP